MAKNNDLEKFIVLAGAMAESAWLFYTTMTKQGANQAVATAGMQSWISGALLASVHASQKPPEAEEK